VNAVALSHENTKINRLFINQRIEKGIKVIPVGSAASQYLSVLRQNQLIALLGDRVTLDTGIKVDFFKRPTVVPKGPAVLSLRTGAPIVPGFMVRLPDDRFNLVFEEPIDPANCTIKDIAHRIVSTLEKHIREYPSQWFLFYKVWDSK
jgi:KDO2-lipid IV(A) lauroyltransferase